MDRNAVLAPLISRPSDNHTYSPSPDLSVWPRDILLWTAKPHFHPFHLALQFNIFQQKNLLIIPAGGRSKFPNQNSFQIPLPGSCQNIMTNYPSIFPSWGPSQTFWLNILPHHPGRVYSETAQKTPTFQPELTPIYRPIRIPSQKPSYTPFTKSHPKNPLPHTQPTTVEICPVTC